MQCIGVPPARSGGEEEIEVRSVVLVRHAEPLVDPHRNASGWILTDAGRDAARAIAPGLVDEHPDVVVASTEHKARETGEIIADALELPMRTHEGLGEQGRDGVPYVADREVFLELVHQHFENPARVILGQETSHEAAARFGRVVAELGRDRPEACCPILVSHGRVMASYLASVTSVDAWELWMPDAIAVDLECGTVRRLIAG